MSDVQNNIRTYLNETSSEPFRLILNNWYGPSIYPIFWKLKQTKFFWQRVITTLPVLWDSDLTLSSQKVFFWKLLNFSHWSSKIVLRASRARLCVRIDFHLFQKDSKMKLIEQLENIVYASVNKSGLQHIFTTVGNSLKAYVKSKNITHMQIRRTGEKSTVHQFVSFFEHRLQQIHLNLSWHSIN